MSGLNLADFWSLFGTALFAAFTSALLCGALGFFVVVRRVAFVSAALAQISGLGVAAGFLLGALLGVDPHQHTPVYLDPVVLAIIVSALAAAALGYASRVSRTSTESVVAFAYLAASALAILVLASPIIVQEAHEVGDLLFGNTVAVRREHVFELSLVAAVVLIFIFALFKELLFASFDREMAQVLGIPVTALELSLSVAIGISVTVSTRTIGALPVFAFLVLPSGAALIVSRSVKTAVALSILGAVVAAGLGFYLSVIWEWPTGPLMVACAALYWPLAGLYRLVARHRLT